MPYPPKDGGAIATFSLAKNLAKLANVSIFAMNTSKHYFEVEKIPPQIRQQINFYTSFVDTDIKITKLLINLLFSKLPYNAERFLDLDFEAKLINLLTNTEFDIIQFEGLYVLPYLKLVKHLSNALTSYRAHNIESEIWQRNLKTIGNPLKKFYLKILVSRLKKFEQSFINQYDILLPITDRDKLQFEQVLNNKKPALTVPTGVNIDEYPQAELINDETVFFIGALDWIPNQQGLLWFVDFCLDDLINQKPTAKLIVAGRNAPKWLVEKLKQHKSITFLGEIDDAKSFMLQNNVMIVPLFSGGGMRIKIIEAMAYGKAIVTTTIGAEGINARNKENIFIADKPSTFVNYIVHLLENGNLRQKIGENARAFILQNFDNFAIAKKLYEFYSQQIEKNN